MKYWKKIRAYEQKQLIQEALALNIDYNIRTSLGVPGSKLDSEVFYDQATFLKDAPFLQAIVQNPNHIGCHTLGDSEPYFSGTQGLEQEVISILSEDLLGADPQSCDGYVASGGTEANIQACWMYRNLYLQDYNATAGQIAIIASEDTHYSVNKASNLLQIDLLTVAVHQESREIDQFSLLNEIGKAKERGILYFIAVCNMGTTMFGSIDDPEHFASAFQTHEVEFRIHVDGAFGGFIYPVTNPDHNLGFKNPLVSSITLDAHKMLQAPYGTGVFLARKNLIQHVYTKEAKYVNGMDLTLSGSRSGANAIAVWMILQTYGPYGWLEKLNTLMYRTRLACDQLDALGIRYFRNPFMNIIAINAQDIPPQTAQTYGLVPDTHSGKPAWYKVVVMEHVEIDALMSFTNSLKVLKPSVSESCGS